jgi:para-nitrobenzyl esterase
MSSRDRLPVFVFIHGGGLTGWSSSMFDGAALVAETGVIVVTMNYRLGVLGFLAHPALAPESGNYGFQDQQAALKWVHDNIARFGGDPGRVTLGGHSSGGASVCAHLVSAVSQPLFQQAVMLSSGCQATSMQDAQQAGESFAEAVGCADLAAADECLRSVPVTKLLDQQNDPTSEWFADLIWDTPELRPHPFEAVVRGAFKQVPILLGATRDEVRSFVFEDAVRRGEQPPQFRGFTEAQYHEQLANDYRDLGEPLISAIAAEYAWPADADEFTAAYLLSAIGTDTFVAGGCFGRLLTRQFADNNDAHTYVYEFNHRNGPGFLPNPTQFEFGAGHSSELSYLFPGFSKGRIAPLFNRQEERLASAMKQWLGSYVKRGAPRSAQNPAWQPYDAQQRTLSIRAGNRSKMITDERIIAEHHCTFWYDLFDITDPAS